MRRERYHGLAIGLLLAGAAWAWWRPFRVEVRGASMRPALEDGDFLVAVRRATIREGSLVVLEHPLQAGLEMVKRVTGSPGTGGDLVPGSDECWVVGDNESASTDSRTFGPVPRASINGVVVLRYWPLNGATFRFR